MNNKNKNKKSSHAPNVKTSTSSNFNYNKKDLYTRVFKFYIINYQKSINSFKMRWKKLNRLIQALSLKHKNTKKIMLQAK